MKSMVEDCARLLKLMILQYETKLQKRGQSIFVPSSRYNSLMSAFEMFYFVLLAGSEFHP